MGEEKNTKGLRSSVIVIEFNAKGKWLDVDDIQVLDWFVVHAPRVFLSPRMSLEEFLLWHEWHVAKPASISALIYGNPGRRNK